MRVLHIISGLNCGGAEGVLYRLVVADKNDAHHVVSLMDSGGYGDRLAAASIPVDTLDMPRGRVTLKGLISLYRLIRTIEPDVVQTWMYHADLIGGLAARLAGKRAVVWGVRASDAHNHASDLFAKALVWLCGLLSRVIPARVVFASIAGATVHRQLGYSALKMDVIANGYDTAWFAPDRDARDRQRAAWNTAPGVRLIGMVARWDPLKDHEVLIVALAKLDALIDEEWSCVLVGAGMNDSNGDLVALLRRHRISERVRLLGPISDIASVMNALDVHVLSSKSEAFPNVVAEAMACGTPCVVTDVGDARVIVDSTGWVVPHSDSAGLAEALKTALVEARDAAKWQARREECRSRILKRYGLEHMVVAYKQVWEEAFKEQRYE